MNDTTRDTVGVDISKAHLDAYRLSTGGSARFANHAAGFKKLASWIGDVSTWVVYESTGPWHREFEETLAATLPLARMNAMRARRFAQAMGQEAKTDAMDAKVLAMMGAAVKLRRVQPPPPVRRDLDELHTARDALVKDRTAALNRQKHVRHGLLRCQLKQRLDQIDRQIKALDKEMGKLIAADKALSRQARVLTSIPGIAQVTAAGLLADMPELGRIDAKAAASLAGLAPMTRESGQWTGRSFIRGGRARVRRMLYMAAVTAVRHNPDMGRKYRELRERGKPPKVALTAIMRKMIVLANTLMRQDRLWVPSLAAPTD